MPVPSRLIAPAAVPRDLAATAVDVHGRALQDGSWRAREMSLKVIRRHGLDDPDGLVDRLAEDPVERVRIQAWMALVLPVPHEQQA